MPQTTDISNSQFILAKVDYGRRALSNYQCFDRDDEPTSIVDLVCDLMHYAERIGADAYALIGSATSHFESEGGGGHEPDDIALSCARGE